MKYPQLSNYERMLLGLPYDKTTINIPEPKEEIKKEIVKEEEQEAEEEDEYGDYLDEYVSYLNAIAKSGVVF